MCVVLQNYHLLKMSVELSSHLCYGFYYFIGTGCCHSWFPPLLLDFIPFHPSQLPLLLSLTVGPGSEADLEGVKMQTISRMFFHESGSCLLGVLYYVIISCAPENPIRVGLTVIVSWLHMPIPSFHYREAIFLLSSPLPSCCVTTSHLLLAIYTTYSCAGCTLIKGILS